MLNSMAEVLLTPCSWCCMQLFILWLVATYRLDYLSMTTKRWRNRRQRVMTGVHACCPVALVLSGKRRHPDSGICKPSTYPIVTLGNVIGHFLMGMKMLDLSSQGGVILLHHCPINSRSEYCVVMEKEFVVWGVQSSVVCMRGSIEGARMDGAPASVSSKEFREWRRKVMLDEGGDDILVTIGDNEVVASACCIEIVLPSRAWVDARLRTSRRRGLILLVSLHGFDPFILIGYLTIKDHG